jgi:hypothetical protein
MRLLLAEHHHFPRLTFATVDRFRELTAANAREYLEVDLRIQFVGRMPLPELFRHDLPYEQRSDLNRSVISPQDQAIREIIVRALDRCHRDTEQEELSRMIEEHPLYGKHRGRLPRREIFLRAAEYQVEVLRSLYAQTLPDETSPVTDRLFGQATAWETLVAHQDRAELLVTTHPIASAEKGQTLPVALRGGINAGLVAHNPGPLQGVVVFSTYPFLTRDGIMLEERGAPPADPIPVMALYLVHELGHLIRRWGHDWTHPAWCVMRPALSLDYEAWFHRVLAHGPCRLRHPRMKMF